MDEIWETANMFFDEQKDKIKTEEEEENKCKHIVDNWGVCKNCGGVIDDCNISSESEWNNYKDESGNYAKNTQRGDTFKDDNPYSIGGTLSFNTNTLIGKMSLQMTFNHKQKTYWLIGKDFENAACLLNIKKSVVEDAKRFWHNYMESGKLTRASVRKGLIASCLYHACIKNNCPIEREEIQRVFECSAKTLSKGEKVFFEIFDEKKMTYTGINVQDSNSFIRYCSLLKLPYSMAQTCIDLYDKYEVQLQAVTPKSAVGGIITYIVKNKMKLKIPTKTVISATVDVCTPTINKVIYLLETIDK